MENPLVSTLASTKDSSNIIEEEKDTKSLNDEADSKTIAEKPVNAEGEEKTEAKEDVASKQDEKDVTTLPPLSTNSKETDDTKKDKDGDVTMD